MQQMALAARHPSARVRLLFGCNPNLGIIKYGGKRGAATVRKRIHPALAIVRDESPDGHGLHRMVGDANRAVNNAGRDENKITRSCGLSVVVGLSTTYPSPAPWEGCDRRLTRRRREGDVLLSALERQNNAE
jgi:hypothetical protein